MEAKHTPGPWFWADSCSYRRLSSQATGHDGDVLHAVVQHSDGHPDVHFPNGGYKGPDARLIGAAPDMLAALQDIAETDPIDAALDPQRAVRIAQAVIAKATQ